MAINFPDSPSAGDTHTEAGLVWLFDGEKWASNGNQAILADIYVKKSGDDMSGDLTLGTDKIVLDAGTGDADITGYLRVSSFLNAGTSVGPKVTLNSGNFNMYGYNDNVNTYLLHKNGSVHIGGADPATDPNIFLSTDGTGVFGQTVVVGDPGGAAGKYGHIFYTSTNNAYESFHTTEGVAAALSIYSAPDASTAKTNKFRVTTSGKVAIGPDVTSGNAGFTNITLNPNGTATFDGTITTNNNFQMIGTGKSIIHYNDGTNDDTNPPIVFLRGLSSNVTRYSVMPTGTVNIGNTGLSEGNFTSGSQNIHLNADGTALKLGGGDWGTISDERAKEAIVDYKSGLEEVNQLRPRSYRFIGNEKTYIGLVAQETESVMPEMVTQGKGTLPDGTEVDDFKTLNSTALTFALVNAVKELSAEVNSLKARLDADI